MYGRAANNPYPPEVDTPSPQNAGAPHAADAYSRNVGPIRNAPINSSTASSPPQAAPIRPVNKNISPRHARAARIAATLPWRSAQDDVRIADVVRAGRIEVRRMVKLFSPVGVRYGIPGRRYGGHGAVKRSCSIGLSVERSFDGRRVLSWVALRLYGVCDWFSHSRRPQSSKHSWTCSPHKPLPDIVKMGKGPSRSRSARYCRRVVLYQWIQSFQQTFGRWPQAHCKVRKRRR
ncbi:hypothetical protein K438DRAFT_854516 [Mycena galopus ATCC 62051]|nr:hypothetical protein K438DRAFT_854516 [Mycena galopus ATCC 62051]